LRSAATAGPRQGPTESGLPGAERTATSHLPLAATMSFAFALSALLALALLIAGAATAPSTAQAQGEGKKVLIYTGTTGFRHSDAINNGRPVLQGALEDIGFEVDWEDCNGFGTGSGQCQNTDKNPRIFTGDNLSQYDALVFFNVSDYWSGAGGSPGQLFNASQ